MSKAFNEPKKLGKKKKKQWKEVNNKDKSINAKEINDHKDGQQSQKWILRKDHKTDKHLARLVKEDETTDTEDVLKITIL